MNKLKDKHLQYLSYFYDDLSILDLSNLGDIKNCPYLRYKLQDKDDQYTPRFILDRVYNIFEGYPTLDPTNNIYNTTKADHYFTRHNSCLDNDWILPVEFKTVFCNPSYSNQSAYVNKVYELLKKNNIDIAILLTLPSLLHNKTTSHIFQDWDCYCLFSFYVGRINFVSLNYKNTNQYNSLFTLITLNRRVFEDYEIKFKREFRQGNLLTLY